MRPSMICCQALVLAACSAGVPSEAADTSGPTEAVEANVAALLGVMPAMTAGDYAKCDNIFGMMESEGGFASVEAMPRRLAALMDNEATKAYDLIGEDLSSGKVQEPDIFYRGSYYKAGIVAEAKLPFGLMKQAEICGEPIGSGGVLTGLVPVGNFYDKFEVLAGREATSTESLGLLAVDEVSQYFAQSDELDVSACFKNVVEVYSQLSPSDESLANALPVLAAAHAALGADLDFLESGGREVEADFVPVTLEGNPEAKACVEAVNAKTSEYLEGAMTDEVNP